MNGGFTFRTLPRPAYFGGAEDDAEIHRPPVHLQRFGCRRLLGLLITHELDADEQARPANVTDERVARLHGMQGVNRVLAQVGAGLKQAVSLENFQGCRSGSKTDRELAKGQSLIPGWNPVSAVLARTPARGKPPPTPFPKTRKSGVTP